MKYRHTIILGLLGLAITNFTNAAGFGKLDLKKDVSSVKQLADKVKSKKQQKPSTNKASASNKQKKTPVAQVAKNSGSDGALSYAPDNLTSFTQCAGLPISNLMVGYREEYTFQQGFSTKSRTGFIKRQKGEPKNDCILPTLKPMQFAYFEVDEKKFEAMGSSHDWDMQCVKSANPGQGSLSGKEPKGEWPYKVDYLSGKDMMLYCGNSEGIKECATGSNSSRSGAWKKKLNARGKLMMSVYATTSTLAPAGGEKLYCQYYNKKSGKSLFGFEFQRVRH